jgi:hypothetical protein
MQFFQDDTGLESKDDAAKTVPERLKNALQRNKSAKELFFTVDPTFSDLRPKLSNPGSNPENPSTSTNMPAYNPTPKQQLNKAKDVHASENTSMPSLHAQLPNHSNRFQHDNSASILANIKIEADEIPSKQDEPELVKRRMDASPNDLLLKKQKSITTNDSEVNTESRRLMMQRADLVLVSLQIFNRQRFI